MTFQDFTISMMLTALWASVVLFASLSDAKFVDYTGHKVFTITPKSLEEVKFLHRLRDDYSVDLWNEPRHPGVPVLTHLRPELENAVKKTLQDNNVDYEIAIQDLQSVIVAERRMNAPSNVSRADGFDFGVYNEYEDIIALIEGLAKKYPKIAKLEAVGKSFENRPIYALRIGGGDENKPAIMMECGVHAREWTSVAVGAYLVNRLVTTYDSDPEIKSLVDKYEFAVVVDSNPDGYVYSRTVDRLWRKTRSRSSLDPMGVCRGVDANRNFDVDHCGPGTSFKPCNESFCGDKPFSESEARALRDLMIELGDRIKAYFSIHAFSQLWVTPYGTKKELPPDYPEMERVATIGINALSKKYGTKYIFGSITNVV